MLCQCLFPGSLLLDSRCMRLCIFCDLILVCPCYHDHRGSAFCYITCLSSLIKYHFWLRRQYLCSATYRTSSNARSEMLRVLSSAAVISRTLAPSANDGSSQAAQLPSCAVSRLLQDFEILLKERSKPVCNHRHNRPPVAIQMCIVCAAVPPTSAISLAAYRPVALQPNNKASSMS